MNREKAIKKYEKELIDVAYPYWEAEAEIVQRFFKRKPSREDHIFWLKAQLWKELHPVDGYFSGLHRELARLAEMFPQVDRDIDRHQYRFLLERMFREGRKVKGGPLERKVAKAMEVIYQDEKNHFREAARQAAGLIKNQQDLRRMERAVRGISLQRVYMRNEMFKSPLSEKEIQDFIRLQAR